MFGEDSFRDCMSLVLMLEKSKKIVRRDLVSGAEEVLLECPFGPKPKSSPLHSNRVLVKPNYVGKFTNLSL